MTRPPDPPPGPEDTETERAADIKRCTSESDHPLRMRTAKQLAATFSVRENWGFHTSSDPFDDDAVSARVHVVARKRLLPETPSSVQARLHLFVQCARSRNPFVFVATAPHQNTLELPFIGGGPDGDVSVRDERQGFNAGVPPAALLGLDQLPFLAGAAFTRAWPAGKRPVLPRPESLKPLLQPLFIAYRVITANPTTSSADDLVSLVLTWCVGVLDAPLQSLTSPDLGASATARDWVRIARPETAHEPLDRPPGCMIDVIRHDFLNTYIHDHLLPFAEAFAALAVSHEHLLRQGVKLT